MTSDAMRFTATPEKEQLYPNGRYLIYRLWACRSGVDRYVRNVKAAGSNPAKSTFLKNAFLLKPVNKLIRNAYKQSALNY
jgi:hypothetical protein